MSAPAVRFYDLHPGVASLREEVLAGLARTPKAIPPKFFEEMLEKHDRLRFFYIAFLYQAGRFLRLYNGSIMGRYQIRLRI